MTTDQERGAPVRAAAGTASGAEDWVGAVRVEVGVAPGRAAAAFGDVG
jgi:hypothetical protein